MAERLAGRSPEEIDLLLARLSADQIAHLFWRWDFWGRPSQLAPLSKWATWLLMAGRGYGKTRAGAEWVRQMAAAHPDARIALVAATLQEARSVMVEGPSGLLAVAPPDARPLFEPSLRRLTWPNGAQALLYSAAEPESLRGAEHSHAWADEIGKWGDGESAWDMLAMTLRAGRAPRAVATTTPRPVPLVRRLLADKTTRTVVQPTSANRGHLATDFLTAMARYRGTRLGRQELEGELIEELEGALWTRAGIEAAREVPFGKPVRVVIGVDPAAGSTSGRRGDATGIVAAAVDRAGVGCVLEDATVTGLPPSGWAFAVARCAARHNADRIVVEANQGGEMVRTVLGTAGHNLPIQTVFANRSKAARAEPVSLLYARGEVRHEHAMRELEDELCGFTAAGYTGPGRSPDRADALVWALSHLMLPGAPADPRVRALG